MKKLLLILLLIFAFVTFARLNNTPEKEILPAKQMSPALGKPELTGWIAAWDSQKASTALPPVMDKFGTFSPMLYRVMDDSTLGRHNVNNMDEIISYAREKNIPVAPVITDEGDAERINALLYDDTIQKAFVQQLVEEAEDERFSGWSIDIEKLQSKDKEAFSEFIRIASDAMHKNNLKLNVIVYGRDADESYDPARAHDYQVLGEYADQVQLMIYYYNNEYTDPGGQTPLDWYRSVLSYARETIPQEKIVVGLSTYGNDWGAKDDEVEGLTYDDVSRRLEETNATVSYDKNESSMVAKYEKDGTQHTLYYETARTITEKMKLAQSEFGINKFAFWQIPAADPELWKVL